MHNLREVYTEGKNRLQKAGVQSYEFDARQLLFFVFSIDANQYLLNQSMPFGEEEEKKVNSYFEAIQKRSEKIPLQYITGEQNFCGLDFYVNENVLIPRLDTEVLVEKILEYEEPGQRVMDMCTGSGCIAITLQKLGGFQVMAVDISEEALTLARKNAQRNQAQVTFFQSNMFEQLSNTSKVDVIVSNPPYIESKVVDELDDEVKKYEPRLALDGMEDGLHFYRILAREGKRFLNEGGRLYVEIGFDQAEAVKEIFGAQGFLDIQVYKDLAGLDRVVAMHR
ncbi:peptide chain release factor N(5)-glutamine methyltransferase [Lachnospiraceae bacterium oral taxon 096]|jgi:protein-(glutamine-N5) methyltransferase, release factor-specific|nr:peptide chain release factor N(5)-glutamine methyltransferase [Lachnospiraceae bacterium]PTL27551.1 peptide chain release factor N(5)-glutamine methyltransferase [Lachnospiraceae bacterium oral taxon 096]PTL27991.1 peptide chain release factor N(5)-glutamine methyltransferase [Lachnospiraceae bacterium oral taxon 096]QUI96834.1 peptide chain release factor N(5)-glutamine methyltransferase [Lachnospiraceae bacterium oral taxon 096]RKW33500.1 MAG: peptide chain release factor N(5)-glutamine me